ncbi:MAG: helix-turn-helix domain-containing protein, partial [Promethearchaeota archaeon]
MSLKEFTKEIFTRYGLTEEDINVYLKYLRAPYATISEVFMYYEEGEIEYAKVEEITKKLVEMGFIKKIEGMVDRYIPLEPYFELFTNESEIFRNQIAEIKTAVLADQSNRFEKLEAIQNNSVKEIDTAVDTQVNAFFKDSDNKNTDKKQRIDKATTRFKDTSKSLEKELHDVIEADYSRLTGDINRIDKESDDVWDVNSSKFKSDNDTLNKDLTEITQAQVKSSKGQESNIRNIIDALNSDLKNISSSFVGDNEKEINTAKDNITEIITDLLKDFSTRVDNLEKELKKDLDDHVDRHKNIANELKPKMEQILEKYLERMDKIVTDLKERISRLLTEHSNHLQNTTNNIESDIHAKVDNRHLTLKDQVNTHKSTALTLLENLLDSANRFSDFSEDMAKQGLFFFGGKKKKYVARWKQVEQDVASLSRP